MIAGRRARINIDAEDPPPKVEPIKGEEPGVKREIIAPRQVAAARPPREPLQPRHPVTGKRRHRRTHGHGRQFVPFGVLGGAKNRVKKLTMKKSRVALAARARANHNDLNAAVRIDDLVCEDRRSRLLGLQRADRRGARWKIWVPRAMLRVSFQDIVMGYREAARVYKASHTTVSQVRSAVSNAFLEVQRRHLQQDFLRASWRRQFCVKTLLVFVPTSVG